MCPSWFYWIAILSDKGKRDQAVLHTFTYVCISLFHLALRYTRICLVKLVL
jgi:hypothetical protein